MVLAPLFFALLNTAIAFAWGTYHDPIDVMNWIAVGFCLGAVMAIIVDYLVGR